MPSPEAPVEAPVASRGRARHGGEALVGWLAVLLAGCASGGAFSPKGDAAADIAGLWWLMLAMATPIYLVVIGLLVRAAMRARGGRRTASDARGESWFVLGGGIALPAVVLTVLLGFNIETLATQLDGRGTVDVEVTGNLWWWEVTYPEHGIVTANELHIPVGEQVRVRLVSDDVVHSFWVPELAGKRDVVPGRENTLVMNANEPGVYRGQCAEFCGIQHANMAFFVIAHPPEEFAAWAEGAAEPAREPTTESQRQGRAAFLDSSCVGCHAIRGTSADGQLGPDLTHFGSRRTIGAGAAPNDRGHLAGWIADAQSLKPGNHMPPQDIASEDLPAMLDYLESLE